MSDRTQQLEAELEGEYEHPELHEMHENHEMHEGEGEGEFGALLSGIGSFLGEGEGEDEYESHESHEMHELHELESELGHESSHEAGHEAGHEMSHETEFEGEFENEYEYESEDEDEQFFGKAFRSIGRFVKKNAPLLKQIAKIAAPLVATAVGGPAAGALAGKLTSMLESEMEGEGEFEIHELHEMHEQHEQHEMHEMHEIHNEASLMAEIAARTANEAEAEAMVGAAVSTRLSLADRRELRRVMHHLIRGTAVLTRVLRRNRRTRPAVRAVPAIVDLTVKSLRSQANAGRVVTPAIAAKTLAIQTQRVLGSPKKTAYAISDNVKGAARATKANKSASINGGRPKTSGHRRHRAVAG